MNIEDLISTYLDGELSAEAEAEMHYRLSISPEERQLFREHMSLRGAARDRELLAQPSNLMRAALFTRLAQEGMNRSTANQAGMMPDAPLPVERTPAAMPSDARFSRPSILVRWGIPAACAIVAFVAGRFVWTGTDAVAPEMPPAAAAPSGGTHAPGADGLAGSNAGAMRADGGSSGIQAGSRQLPAAGSSIISHPTSASRLAPTSVDENVTSPARSSRRGSAGDIAEGRDGSGATRQRRSSGHGAGSVASLDARNGGSYDTVRTVVNVPTPHDAAATTDLKRNDIAPPSSQVPPTSSHASGTESQTSAIASRSMASGTSTDGVPPGDSSAASRLRAEARLAAVADSLNLTLRARAAEEAMAESDRALFVPLVALNAGGFLGSGFPGIDIATRLGVEFTGGEHQLYAMFGSMGYGITTVDMVGAVESGSKNNITVPAPVWGSAVRRDTWYGVGYRYAMPLMERMSVGGAIEGGIGSRYLRFALSFPTTYQVNGVLRLELAPALQYISSVGETVTSTSSWVPVSATRKDRHDLRESLDATDRLRVGLGLGLSFLFH